MNHSLKLLIHGCDRRIVISPVEASMFDALTSNRGMRIRHFLTVFDFALEYL